MQGSSEGFDFLDALYSSNGKQVQDFDSFFLFLDKSAREKGIPLCGQFGLTPLCNFSCRMCYVHLDADQLAGRQSIASFPLPHSRLLRDRNRQEPLSGKRSVSASARSMSNGRTTGAHG